MTEPLLRITDVHASYGATRVLRGVSLQVMRGETACLIGPSGSGKSTLLRTINGLAAIDSGSIRVGGLEVADPALDLRALRTRVGIVFQQFNLFPHRRVLENIVMAPIQVLGEPRAEVTARARDLLARVRLGGKERAYPGELSGGQQQRVAIARALAMRPEIMLFDEVTASLDPETRQDVLLTIRDLAEGGMTCVLVTHEMAFAREVADHIHFTDRGVIVEHGKPADILTRPQDPRTREFLGHFI
jgi:polar amino acid transport system ATP-binding protein